MARPGYPRNLLEFAREFATEEQCLNYLVACRWPDGFRCRRCGHEKAWPRPDRKAMRCAKCDLITSATAGTAMHRSRLPLQIWLWAAYLVVTDKRGISALQLQRQLGLTRYEPAFQMLHKLRAGMVAPSRTLLDGVVEVDESFIGAPKRGRARRTLKDKALVCGAVEVCSGRDKKGEIVTFPGRIRLRRVPEGRSKAELLRFVHDNVEPGAVVVTDGLGSYKDIDIENEHRVESTTDGMKQDDVLKHYHLVIANLKTWLAGTHHGRVAAKHLQAYLDEYTFRFNRRASPQAAFQTILGITSRTPPRTYAQLYANEPAMPLPFDHNP